MLLDAGNKYGESIIKEYSIKLNEELGKGYSQRNLRNMRQFYKVSLIWQTLSAKLPWSHNVLLISKVKDMEIRKWYMKETIKNGWSHDIL